MQSTTHTYIHKHSQRQKRVPINNELRNELLNAICNFSLIVFLLLHAFAMQHPNSGCHFRISTFSHCHRKRRWLYEITNILPQLGRRREKCCLRVDVKEVKKCETWNGKITKKAEKKTKKEMKTNQKRQEKLCVPSSREEKTMRLTLAVRNQQCWKVDSVKIIVILLLY